ncbi:hypothetical protein GCM10010149_63700 [Nonomuraea roseoviolacea subsp. roseoviolacea]|uniref:hypothetical protein n=1 Tax=Nonomuraea roseoviolacea TaxID=103837 RepID=UPI0031E193A0
MLVIMTEPEEPVLRSGKSERQRAGVESVRAWGTATILAGGMLSVAAFVFSGGEPSWQVLMFFVAVALIGLGLRLEAAIREGSGS